MARCEGLERVRGNSAAWRVCDRRVAAGNWLCAKHREAADWVVLVMLQKQNSKLLELAMLYAMQDTRESATAKLTSPRLGPDPVAVCPAPFSKKRK